MLRASSIIFTAVLSRLCLRRRLAFMHWLGVFTCCVGVVMIGLSDFVALQPHHEAKAFLIGFFLILMSQFVGSSVAVASEFMIKGYELPAMETLGWTGVWDMVILVLLVLPVAQWLPGSDNGHIEDTIDTIVMLSNSMFLAGLELLLLIFDGFLISLCIVVTALLSSVHRKMLGASSVSVVWIFGLIVYYGFDSQASFGEKWTKYSFLQLGGFGFLVAGQAIYGGLWCTGGPHRLESQPSLDALPAVRAAAAEEGQCQSRT
mmetsp:Transcript_28202/g.60059  ORF Transcript_28202/g.60059 Transcript_28202/m.60059 type:complete len:261 (+) Transcript_28202:2-784(+)